MADRVGKSRPQVANTLRLLRLPHPIQELVATGKVSAGHAKVLLGVEEARTQEQLALEVVDKQLSVRALEARLKQLVRVMKSPSRRRHPQAVFLKAAAEELTHAWGTRVEIKTQGKAGTLVLHYASEGELDRLFEALKAGPKKA